MKIISGWLLLGLLTVKAGLSVAQPSLMFRGNPSHNVNAPGIDGQIYNTLCWKFPTGGAIRSSIAAGRQLVYFGSADGFLYALSKSNGQLAWKYPCGSAVTSSPACSDGLVFTVSENQQLFALNASTGKLAWQKTIGQAPPYDWGFDYYTASPVVYGDTLLVASSDGHLHCLNQSNGTAFWESTVPHFLRATPAVYDGTIYLGDTFGDMHALDAGSGKERWVFHTMGSALDNDTIGFDRKAIISSAIVQDDHLVFGSRDGFLYCLDRASGKLNWKFNHNISWVISSPSVVNGRVITGTSDGHFVQAVDLATGHEVWRTYGTAPLWSSPLVVGHDVYIGGNEGVLYCLDATTGEKRPRPFCVDAKIFSSPVVSDSLLYFGADDGSLYCLRPEKLPDTKINRYIYWQQNGGSMFLRNGVDVLLKNFLARKGYEVIGADQLLSFVSHHKDSGEGNVIVFISSKLPPSLLESDTENVLRRFLQSGGIVADAGNIALACNLDDSLRFKGFNFTRCATITGIPFRFNDLRSFGGIFAATATADGKRMGMKDQWTATCPVDTKDVDIILGKDEKGRASAWIKNIGKGRYLQLWVDQMFPEDYNFFDRVIMHVEDQR